MRKILIPLCLVLGTHVAIAQQSYNDGTIDRLFTEGKTMFSLNNYAGCIDKLEAYKSRSENVDLIQEADYMIVYSAYEQGRKNAPELLKEFLDTYKDTRHADIISYLIASTHFGKGEYEKAIFWFNQSNIDLLTPKNQEEYSFRLAYSLLQTGNMDKARGYFSRIKQIGTKYKDASSYYMAYIDYASGKYDNSLTEFVRLKENPAYSERSLYYIAQIYFIQNKYAKAIRSGEELLSSYPNNENNSEVYHILGNSYYHQSNQDKALNMLSKYVSSTDKPLRGDLYLLGICQFNKGKYSNAVNSLGRTVSESDALTQNAYLYLGQSYLKLNDKNNARMAFEAAATASADRKVKEVAMFNYALLIHETAFTGFGEAVIIFEDFLNDFPNSQYADKVNDYLVEIYLTTKNYQSALTSINKIKQPSSKILQAKQDILFQLGTQAFANTKMIEATDLFSKAISLGTYDVEARDNAYFWRGEAYYRMNEYDHAISDYRAYLNNTRKRNTEMYSLAYYNLGYSNFKLKNYDEALNRFNQYIELDANQQSASYADAYNRIGDCLFHNRQFSLAEESYTKAAQLQPSAGDYAIYQKGFLLGLQKDYMGKVTMMDRLIQEYPESQYTDDALFEKGHSYVLMEKNSAAIQAFDQLVRQYPQSSLARKAGIQLGLLYYNDNQADKAAEAYKKVISDYPGSDEAKTALEDLKSVYIDLNDISSFAAYANSLGNNVRVEVSEQDSLTYLAAEKLFMRGDDNGARHSLTAYLQSFPQGAFSSNANFYLGSIAFSNKEYDEAERLFNAVIESGDIKFMEEAVARNAEMKFIDKDYAAALENFKHLQTIAEKPENKEAAKLGVMRCAQLTDQPNEALIAANELLKEPKLSPELATEAHYVRAKAYIALKQDAKALPDLKKISKDTRTAQGAEAKYLLAQHYFNAGDDKNTISVLEEFAKDGTPHQYWLARGFILWADVYIRKGDDVQARVYLNSLRTNYKGNDDITEMIESRLGKLK